MPVMVKAGGAGSCWIARPWACDPPSGKAVIAWDHGARSLLILHGQADQRVPIFQGTEYFQILAARAETVPMVTYPGSLQGRFRVASRVASGSPPSSSPGSPHFPSVVGAAAGCDGRSGRLRAWTCGSALSDFGRREMLPDARAIRLAACVPKTCTNGWESQGKGLEPDLLRSRHIYVFISSEALRAELSL